MRGWARLGAARQGAARQARRGKAGQCEAGHGKARQNGDGERPVAARKDGLHLNNDERYNKLIGE